MAVTDYISYTNFKTRGGLKLVSEFIFDIILSTEKAYKMYSLKMRNSNFKKEIILKVQKYFVAKIPNLKPTYPVIDTCNIESHEMKIAQFMYSYYCILYVTTQCKQVTKKLQG